MEEELIVINYLNYIIRNKKEMVTPKFMKYIENIMHFQDCNVNIYVNYALSRMKIFFSEKEE